MTFVHSLVSFCLLVGAMQPVAMVTRYEAGKHPGQVVCPSLKTLTVLRKMALESRRSDFNVYPLGRFVVFNKFRSVRSNIQVFLRRNVFLLVVLPRLESKAPVLPVYCCLFYLTPDQTAHT